MDWLSWHKLNTLRRMKATLPVLATTVTVAALLMGCDTPPNAENALTFEVIHTIDVGAAPHGIRFSEDGTMAYVALSGDGQIAVVDLESMEATERWEAGTTPLDLIATDDGWIVSQFRDSTLITPGLEQDTWPIGAGPSLFTPEAVRGRAYIVSEFADRLTALDVATGALVASYPTGQRPYPADVTPDGVLAFVPNLTDGTVSVIDLLSEEIVAAPAVCEAPPGGALTRDGVSYVVACGGSNELAYLNTASFEVTARVTEGVGPRPFSVAMTLDGRFGVVNNAGGETVSILDVAGQRIIQEVTVGEQPIVVRMHPDGRRVFVSNEVSGTVSVLAIPEAPARPRAGRTNEVIVLGMIHGRHRESERYGIDVLKKLIREINPAYVLTEIPPNRFDAAMADFQATDSIAEARVRRFPEYVDALFPLTREMDFEIIPTAGWTTQMADFRSAKLQAISQDPDRAAEWAAYQRANAQADSAIAAGGEPDDPRWIHTDAYDAAYNLRLNVYNDLFNEELGPGGWDTINAAHYAHIARALDAHRGEGARFLITYGAGHKGWFLRELRKRDDIVLLDVAPFLDAIESK